MTSCINNGQIVCDSKTCEWINLNNNKCQKEMIDECLTNPWFKNHIERYKLTFTYFIKNLHCIWHENDKKLNILDLGGYSSFRLALKNIPGIFIHECEYFDLRKTWPTTFDFKKIDVFIATEIMEHLRDLEDSDIATFCSSGIMGMLNQCFLNMKDSAKLLITTPNVCSFVQILNLLRHKSPFMYNLHVREMSFEELSTYLKNANFIIKDISFKNCWTHVNNYSKELRMLKNNNFSIDNREDNMFLICMKNNDILTTAK